MLAAAAHSARQLGLCLCFVVEELRDKAAVEGSCHGVEKMELDCCANVGLDFASSWTVVSGAGVAGAEWTGLRIAVGRGREGVESYSFQQAEG